jgi:hypothetical protein
MKLLTEKGVLECTHGPGVVENKPTQSLVRIGGQRVLVENNPEGKRITGCPNSVPPMKACLLTLKVKQGYSNLVRIDGRRVCLDTVRGKTDGMPAGLPEYQVRSPGQAFVSEV